MFEIVGAWGALFLLGALHGVNPGMGWLFAVGLGMQNGNGRWIWRSLPPLALGHLAAVGVALFLAAVLGVVFESGMIRFVVGGSLLILGVLHLRRHRHPRYGGMRVTRRDLIVWSFLVATTHGAGLMAVPFLPRADVGRQADGVVAVAHAAHTHARVAEIPSGLESDPSAPSSFPKSTTAAGVLATLFHTLGYLVATGLIATLVYYRWGIALIRSTWVNVDLLWAGGLVLTALFVLLA